MNKIFEHRPLRSVRRGSAASSPSVSIRSVWRGLAASAIVLALTACNDWLDVRSETEAKEENLYEKKNGFKEALTGIYMTLSDQTAYGRNLTMTSTEALANIWAWDLNSYDNNPDLNYLTQHDYTNDYAKDNLKAIYQQLFYAITQANVLLKNISDNGSVLDDDPKLKAILTGEATAIRAFCQFDILRLFGQIPGGKGSRQVRLPYSSTTSIAEMPPYYAFDDYVELLDNDIKTALEQLQTSDPVMQYDLGTLNFPTRVTLDDTYFYYRRLRLNYWAVRALQARIDLYLGRTAQAHDEALSVINATTEDGSAVIALNTVSDFSDSSLTPSNLMAPSECLFALSKYNLYSYTNTLFVGNSGSQVRKNEHLSLSQAMFNTLFQGANTAANNRYLRQWNRSAKDSQGAVYPSLCKYWRNTNDAATSMTENLIIPMLRLSEMYLIVMETTTDLAEANQLYTTYMRDRNVLIEQNAFSSLNDVRTEVYNEYHRELIAEGQIFFLCKRLLRPTLLLSGTAMTENDYIIPLPDTEYENQ